MPFKFHIQRCGLLPHASRWQQNSILHVCCLWPTCSTMQFTNLMRMWCVCTCVLWVCMCAHGMCVCMYVHVRMCVCVCFLCLGSYCYTFTFFRISSYKPVKTTCTFKTCIILAFFPMQDQSLWQTMRLCNSIHIPAGVNIGVDLVVPKIY